MNNSSSDSFHALSPDAVLDALDSSGLHGDGRLLALNSYENRVYQVGIEDAAPVVVKFYRPSRWSDAAILEEHEFVHALHAQEIPVVPPLLMAGATLHRHQDHRFAVFTRQGGRAPELDRPGVLEWIGRFLGRIHAVGASQPFVERPALDAAVVLAGRLVQGDAWEGRGLRGSGPDLPVCVWVCRCLCRHL